MLKELWDDGIAIEENGTSARRRRVSDKVADWFKEFESNGEVLIRILLNADEYACLRLGMLNEFKALCPEDLIKQTIKGRGPICFGKVWTADIFVCQSLEWVELLGDKGTKIQKM
jgi:5'-deoxynucleotidase YfbR-like HD superfamily hydrolase